ncbi:type IV pilus assembly protein PilM [Vibrio hepatarius]|uniref:type IV pilus assembly protein PilM n=1 Tax=Vibrio hepatarius TaxID=171383 RepID=UPI00148E658B|nr:type IV pilus assembly protein PilM [Vibrio hepatarius]NOI16176.1 type IV pilus assembly protein PilM [Vibrio hepatarius]
MGKSLVIGVDIGHHSIKAVALKPSKGTFTLVSYQELPIEADIFSDNHLLNYQKIVKKLKELRKSLPLFSRKVALAIPDNAVISKVLQIDSELDTQEREFAIVQAFSHQSPFPVEELNLDFIELPKSGSGQTMSSYQVYATKKEVVDSRVQAVTKAGYQPLLVEIQAHSLTHIWQIASRAQQKPNWLLLDVGLSQSSVCMDLQDKAPFCKDIPLGTQLMEGDEQLEHVMHGQSERFVHGLVEKLQRNIQLLTSVHGVEIEGIWLSGGGASVPMLSEEIAKRLHIECEVLNPLNLFDASSAKTNGQLSSGHVYATAAGLALRGLNWMEQTHAA